MHSFLEVLLDFGAGGTCKIGGRNKDKKRVIEKFRISPYMQTHTHTSSFFVNEKVALNTRKAVKCVSLREVDSPEDGVTFLKGISEA